MSPELDPQGRGRLSATAAQPDGEGRIVVRVDGARSADMQAAVAEFGGEVRTVSDGSILAWMPPSNLGALSDDQRVASVGVARKPKPVATSEGVAQTGATQWQAQGYDGTGVKVGVVDVGFQQLTTAQAAGRLPLLVTTQNFCGNGLGGNTPHGTAVAEIIHQMAPNAQLYLVCVEFNADLASAEQWLASQGVSIVNASITDVLGGRGDGSGEMGSAVTAGRQAGQLWSVAAGNEADRHYAFNAVDSEGDGAVAFGPGPLTPGPDASELFRFTLPSNGTINLGAKYDAWPITSQEFDVCVWTAGAPLGTLIGCQGAGQSSSPTEPITGFFQSGLAAGSYVLAILRTTNTTITPRIDMYFEGSEGSLQRVTASGSIGEPATSPSAMAVGAYNWRDSAAVEPFSSQGPTIDGRIKPDISGPDGTSSDIFGAFLGTSASTPHVTGAAALLKQGTPSLTPASLQSALQGRAIDAGPFGKDSQFGSGRLFLQLTADGGPAAVTVGGQSLVFVRGSDGALWKRSGNGTWSSLGGSLTADPAVTSMTTGRVDVFVRGRDNALWHLRSDNGGANWGAWEGLGGGLTSAPGAVSWGTNRIDIFVRGGDGGLWHRAYAGFWSGWEGLGGGLASAPAVSSWGPNRLDIFVRGRDNALWRVSWAPGWTAWQSLSGGLTSGPGAVSVPGTTTIDVFARGGDAQLWTRGFNGSTWGPWTALSGALAGDPDPTAFGSQLDVFMVGVDSALWRKTRTNGVWNQSGQPPGWVSLGPPPSTPPSPPPP